MPKMETGGVVKEEGRRPGSGARRRGFSELSLGGGCEG